jgi:hypothetical protein
MEAVTDVRVWMTSTIAASIAALVFAAVLIAVPMVVRHLAVQRVEAMTGRPVSIRDVDLNLFTRRLVFHDVTIASPADAAPLAAISRIEARFRLMPLFRGRTWIDDLLIVDPAVVIVRRAPHHASVEDVIAHWRAREAGEPVEARIARIRVERGRVTFADYGVDPDRRWVLERLWLEAHDIATTADADAGRASARFMVGGAEAAVEVSDLSVRPFRATASVRLEGLDLAPLSAYFPDDSAVRLAGGRFTTRVDVQYDARGFVRASASSTVRDLVVRRAGQDAPFVTIPHVALAARDVTYADTLNAGALTISAEAVEVLDARAPRARPLTIRDIRFTFRDRAVPAAGPGRLTLTARLPGDGAIEVQGTGEIVPPRGDVRVDIRGVDLALAAMWLPPGAAAEPLAGEVGATLTVHASEPGLTVAGRVWLDGLALARTPGAEPFLHDDRVEVTAADVAVDAAGLTLGHLELVASPTVVPLPGAAPLDVSAVSITADGGGTTAREPTRIAARIELPRGGTVTANGQAQLSGPRASLTAVATGVDVTLVRPYLPRDAGLLMERGRLEARLAATWADALDVDGRVTLRDLTVRRPGQELPLVEHGRLDVELTDLQVGEDGLSLDRVRLTGAPVILDGSLTPPQRFEMRELELAARHVTWPARRPIDLAGHAETADGGRATLKGSFHPGSQAADVRLEFDNVALTRAGGYLRDAAPVTIEAGRARGVARLRHAGGGPVRVDAEGTLVDVAATLTAPARTRVIEDRLTFAFDGVVLDEATVAVRSVTIDGSPVLRGSAEPESAVVLHAEVRDLTWPAGGPADVSLAIEAGDGRVDVSGVFTPSTRTLDASVRAKDASLAPFTNLLPMDAPIAGRLDAEADLVLTLGEPTSMVARGDLTVRDLRLGPEDTAPVRAEEIRVDGLALEDRVLHVERVVIAEPSVMIERDEDGSFPLRAMLTTGAEGAASPGSSRRDQDAAVVGASSDATRPPIRFTVEDLRVTGGRVRFIDRTTTPFYSEEVTDLAVTISDLTTAGEERAGLMVQGIIGTDAALDLRGEMAPFAEPFFLEVSGELSEFAVPRTNPYLQRFIDWIARRGQLTTQVHYRIVGDQLRGTNELVVHRLDVQRAREDGRAERLVGVPLGLAVALLKDAKGNIEFTLPVSGELGSPTFSFGDAIRSALSNVLGRLVTSPLRAIASVFRRDDGGDAVRIDPVTFEPGSATLTPGATAHLQRVADVLRASPYVRLEVDGVTSERDLHALRTREIVARIQRTQRTERLDSFAEAARRLWAVSMPAGSEPPQDADGIVRILVSRAPLPSEAARSLAERRERLTRRHLVEAAGIPADRLVQDPAAPSVGVEGDGRVEFTLRPSS